MAADMNVLLLYTGGRYTYGGTFKPQHVTIERRGNRARLVLGDQAQGSYLRELSLSMSASVAETLGRLLLAAEVEGAKVEGPL